MKRLVGWAKQHQSAILLVWVVAAWCLFGVVYGGLRSGQDALVWAGMGTLALLVLPLLVVL